MITAIAIVLALFAGFGLGRIKNRAKLTRIEGELKAAEGWASSEAKSLIARIRAKL